MQYFGGKHRIAKTIAKALEELRQPNQVYLEPFVGAGNIIINMSGHRIGSDNHPDLIMLLQEVQAGTFDFPNEVGEVFYRELMKAEPSALRGFVGFGCSYAGRWFEGYARSGKRNYCLNARNSLMRKRPGFEGVELTCRDYRDWLPKGYLVYCDPPYKQRKPLHRQSFDHEEFWQIVRNWSQENQVVVSEYQAPADFCCIKEIPTKTDISGSMGKSHRVEKLFTLRDHSGRVPSFAASS